MIDQTIAHYEILDQLGEGGMGVVYRGRDTRLDRQVAIKALPEDFASDPERLARFEREAKVLASLNHPHVSSIYGMEKAEGQSFLILELVEGEELAERIAKGTIPVQEALELGCQIAEALEAAHEHGIIHRDLKPANVKVTPEGQVKVLDFGLAKEVVSKAPEIDASSSPTLTAEMTREGVLLGTAAYMSPEQARGQEAGKQADIWAFGCVLYEMLTGRRTFSRPTGTDTLAAILERQPDWEPLPEEVPARVRRVLRRCLEKEPKRRLHDIADARIELEEFLADPEASLAADAPSLAPDQPFWKKALPWGVAGSLALLLALQVWDPRSQPRDASPASPVRFQVQLSPDTPLWSSRGTSAVLSPDGSRLVYISVNEGVRQLFLKNLEHLETTLVQGSEGAYSPFFSPDSHWVAFFTGEALKKVSVSGGKPLTLAEVHLNRGGSWGPDGTIVFAPNRTSGLLRLPDTGGKPEALTKLDKEAGEMTHRWPSYLPDGSAVLYTAHDSIDGFDDARIEILDLETSLSETLLDGGSDGRYVSTGHVAYVREGTLYAIPFDAERLKVTGSPSPLIEELTAHPEHGSAEFSFSREGTLVYSTGASSLGERDLVLVDRSGDMSVVSESAGGYAHPSVSPDGSRLAYVEGDGQEGDIWIQDIAGGLATRLTFTGRVQVPQWSPDSQRIVFSSQHESAGNIYVTAADGSGEPDRLTESDFFQFVGSWSPDGNTVMLCELSDAGGWDIYSLGLQSGSGPVPFVVSEFHEIHGSFSPDGRWVAYTSFESGTPEVYVRPFPGPGGKWRISKGGGHTPAWSGDGRELFYQVGNAVMAVEVEGQGNALRVGAPIRLFEGPFEEDFEHGPMTFDARGDRFVMLRVHEGEPEGPDRTLITVVFNWFETLRGLAAPGR